MTDDEFTATVRSAVRDAFTSGKISTPISSMDLLLSLIASKPAVCSSRLLRLTDLHRLETVLQNLSNRWELGTLSLSREGSVLTITDVHFGNTMADMVNIRKRKRPPIDEEADSAAGDDPDEHSSRSITHSPPPSATPLANMGKELREVYAILQRATAKGRLMAERVCGRILVMQSYGKEICTHSFADLMGASVPFALTSRKRTVPGHVGRTPELLLLTPIPSSVIVYTSSR